MVTGVTRRALNVLLQTERARGREGVVTESATEREGGRSSYAEGVETERGSCDGECDGERGREKDLRKAEGVETERVREREFSAFESMRRGDDIFFILSGTHL